MKWRQAVGHAVFWPFAALLLWWILTPALARLPNPKPGLESRVREAIQEIVDNCTTAEQARAQVQEWSHLWSDRLNSYTVEVVEKEDGHWLLTAEPDRESVHCEPLWKRLLYLDFRMYRYEAVVCGKS